MSRYTTALLLFVLLLVLTTRAASQDWRTAGRTGKDLPALIRRALAYVPAEAALQPDDVVALNDVPRYMAGHLTEVLGYDRKVAGETIRQLAALSEFVVDQRLPVFVCVRGNADYARLERVKPEFGEQAARILASELWHEWLHAVRKAGEVEASEAHVALLRRWRQGNLLTIADKYIAVKERRLRDERLAAGLELASR